MGCITSKAIARSMSIREELRSNRFPNNSPTSTSTWEELLISHCDNDHLFAFVCSNNTITTKFKPTSFNLPNPEPQTDYISDLISDINRITEAQSSTDGVEQPDFSRFMRSKSCQMLRENVTPENHLTGSRSFHTVEEYDALLQRIHELSIESFEDYYSLEDDENKGGITQDLNEASSSLLNLDHFETGWRRKGVAKGLKSLDVSSSTLEFPAIGRFKQGIDMEGEGQVYSPGTYMTPKFGSYNGSEKKFEGNSVFSPQLVAVFEDCMQQLQVEEDNILRHMNGDEGTMQT